MGILAGVPCPPQLPQPGASLNFQTRPLPPLALAARSTGPPARPSRPQAQGKAAWLPAVIWVACPLGPAVGRGPSAPWWPRHSVPTALSGPAGRLSPTALTPADSTEALELGVVPRCYSRAWPSWTSAPGSSVHPRTRERPDTAWSTSENKNKGQQRSDRHWSRCWRHPEHGAEPLRPAQGLHPRGTHVTDRERHRETRAACKEKAVRPAREVCARGQACAFGGAAGRAPV